MNPSEIASNEVLLDLEGCSLSVAFDTATEIKEEYFIFADLPCEKICPECRT